MKTLLAVITAVLVSFNTLAAPVLGIYQPSYRSAEQLQEKLLQLYGDDVKISIDGGQLMMRAEPHIINEIQELLLQLDHAPKIYLVTISHAPQATGAKHYGTVQNTNLQTFRVSDGETLQLIRQSNEQRLNDIGWYRTSVSDVPAQQESLSMRVTSAMQTVAVDISMNTLVNNQLSATQNRVRGKFDEWLAITANPQTDGVKHYGTRRSGGNLYLKVVEQK